MMESIDMRCSKWSENWSQALHRRDGTESGACVTVYRSSSIHPGTRNHSESEPSEKSECVSGAANVSTTI
jgi:hypothetical protein